MQIFSDCQYLCGLLMVMLVVFFFFLLQSNSQNFVIVRRNTLLFILSVACCLPRSQTQSMFSLITCEISVACFGFTELGAAPILSLQVQTPSPVCWHTDCLWLLVQPRLDQLIQLILFFSECPSVYLTVWIKVQRFGLQLQAPESYLNLFWTPPPGGDGHELVQGSGVLSFFILTVEMRCNCCWSFFKTFYLWQNLSCSEYALALLSLTVWKVCSVAY